MQLSIFARLIAVIITRSIQKPLDMITAKTIDISRGNLKGDLDIISPPVIADLASAINIMCHKLQEVNIRGNTVGIEVHDNGLGIPKEDIERIFLKFQQVMPAKGARAKGTGFGLATVKQIILAHGGKVWATSQIGQGSTFYITLSLAA